MNENTITLRSVTLADADLLFAWRNDAETRRASHQSALITEEEHRSWLKQSLANPTRQLYVVEENGFAVGTMRTDLENDTCVLSWAVAPDARGRGVAKRMVALLVSQIQGSVRAEIKVDNAASVKVAEYAGLAFEREEDGILHYKRDAEK